jgi:hypothetical protein
MASMFSRRLRHLLRFAFVAQLTAASGGAAPTQPLVDAQQRNGAISETLGEDAALSRATGLYDSGQYAACVDAFDHLLSSEEPRPLRSPAKIETARTYHGACLIGVGRTTDAERVFRDAILENPQMKAPDGLLFPEAVVELFLRVRESMLEEIRHAERKRMLDAEARAAREQALRERERLRLQQLVAIAERETVVERHSRWIAAIPFGVGQFQNGSSGLGWAMLVGETAAAGLLAGSLYMEAYYNRRSSDPGFGVNRVNSGNRTAILLQTISGYSLLGLAISGIFEAQLSFVPEVRTERIRELPKHLRVPTQKSVNSGSSVSLTLVPWIGSEPRGDHIAGGAIIGVF